VHRDLAYADIGEKALLLDLYVPGGESGEALPVVVWIHGGGWRNGSKENALGAVLVRRGYAVASINYRLSAEAVFPAQIHDCKAAIRWLRAHAEEYHLDADRIGVWGSSAGGHLVALLGTSGDVADLEGELGNAEFSSRVQAVCDWFGPGDLVGMASTEASGRGGASRGGGGPVARLLGGSIEEKRELAISASPVTHVSEDDPPFLIMHGDQDPVVPLGQSEALHKALHGAGAESTLDVIKGAGHGFRGVDHFETVGRFFDAHLKGEHASDGQAKP
jgi:acetyl esterase/lipase